LNLFQRGLDAIEAAAAQLADLDGRFLLPALLLQLTGLGLRALVWRNVVCAAYPDRDVPVASVTGSFLAGVALNSFLPAKGGELAKLALIRSRIHDSCVSTLAATLGVVTLLDGLLGGALFAALMVFGLAPVTLPSVGIAPVIAALGLVAVAAVALRLRPRRARILFAHLAQGAAILRTPRRYLHSVLPLQLAAWVCRVGVAFLVLSAFGIEAGLATAALVVVFNGLSTAVPVPGGVGTQQVLTAYALRGAVPLAGAVSFSVGMQVGVTVVNTLVGLTALMLMMRTFSPFAALRFHSTADR
jgi:Lysylphosphatidylglycerol synthase TM region